MRPIREVPAPRASARPTVLVTGGAGFIGSHIVDRLVGDGRSVAVVDDLSTGDRDHLAPALATGRVRLYELDIRSPELEAIFRREQPGVVLHLAGQLDVRLSVRDPVLDAGVNILGSLNVFEQSRRHGARKVVVASSGGTIYGDARVYPVKETQRATPHSPYGIAKRVLDDYLSFYRRTHGLRSAILALTNVYGPRQDHRGESGAVAIFLGAILAGEIPTVFGDGAQTRDFVFVEDVVDAFVRAMDAGDGLINVGTGRETPVLELLAVCADAAGVPVEPRFAPARAGELRRTAVDATRARRLLEWEPRTDLRTGIARTVEFLRDSLGGALAAQR